MNAAPSGERKDKADQQIAEWGRDRHRGFRKHDHKFQQPPPLFFTQDHHPLWLGDIYRGRSAFLICSGPSFKLLDHSKLRAPGVLTMGLNNSPRTFRPNLWCSVDSPDHWISSIWMDPTIQKFVPISHAEKRVFNSDTWKHVGKVGDCPNVVYYKRNERFRAAQFLWEDCFNWGNHKDYGGGRSIMLPAHRILFTLGVRTVYLLGCDMKMDESNKYHFEQDRTQSSIKGNAGTYVKLNEWFKELRPLFEQQGFHVFNCNKDSGLKAFDYVSYEDALAEVRRDMLDVDTSKERTAGLYETDTREKEEGFGRDPNWLRLEAPKGLRKCRYCGKKCWRASGDRTKPGKVNIVAGCEKIRRKLWRADGARLTGEVAAISTGLTDPNDAVAGWNMKFGIPEQARLKAPPAPEPARQEVAA